MNRRTPITLNRGLSAARQELLRRRKLEAWHDRLDAVIACGATLAVVLGIVWAIAQPHMVF